MSIALRLVLAFLLLCFSCQAFGKCGPSKIIISQSVTGKVIESMREYLVKVSNRCPCPQSKVIVNCFGLNSVETVDSKAIKTLDDMRCIVNDGKAIPRRSSIKFKYAWRTPQDFPVISTNSSC